MGVEERIAEIVGVHYPCPCGRNEIGYPHCVCGWNDPTEGGWLWRDHVASVLAAELGLPALCGEMTRIYAPIDPESGEPRWHEFYDDPHEGQKAANAEGGPLGEAWITAWTQIEPPA